MPWEKQFDREDVLDKAMQAFWQQGYDGTSMKDLITCTGLNPGSIYATFGDKKKLFCAALEHYERQAQALFDDYQSRYSPRRAILALFEKLVADARHDPKSCSCFLVNSAIDAAPKDEMIARTVKAGQDQFEQSLRKLIIAGQESGEIGQDIDPHQTARVLMTLIIGGRVLARGHFDADALQDLVEQADKILV